MRLDQKGFTLLEIIVALAILSLGFLAAVQLFSGGLRMVTYSDSYVTGAVLAHNKFSELELMDFKTDILEGRFENQKGYRWELEVEPYESDLEIASGSSNLKKVSLRVYWSDEDREKEIGLTSLRIMGETKPMTPDQMGLKKATGPETTSQSGSPVGFGEGGMVAP